MDQLNYHERFRILIITVSDFRKTNKYWFSPVARFYALYDYDGTINNNNNRFPLNRLCERHIKVIEGDELEIIEDDEEHMWKVKNLRTNEIGLIPSTIVGANDGDQQRTIQRSSIASVEWIFLFKNQYLKFFHYLGRYIVDCMWLWYLVGSQRILSKFLLISAFEYLINICTTFSFHSFACTNL